MPEPLQLEASCHCGAIQFRYQMLLLRVAWRQGQNENTISLYVVLLFHLSQDQRKRRIRNKHGSWSLPPEKSTDNQKDTLEFVKGEDKLKIYQANVGTKSKPKKRYSSLDVNWEAAEINATFVPNVVHIYTAIARVGRSGSILILPA